MPSRRASTLSYSAIRDKCLPVQQASPEGAVPEGMYGKIVWQNIIFALGVKAILLVLGALGIATMWEAVFGDIGMAFITIFNAMRAMNVDQ